MQFNLSKCHVIHFGKKRDRSLYEYSINGELLLVVSSIRDLGVIFNFDLTFERHISSICCRVSKRLGFITRTSKYFKNIQTLRLLFCALIRPLLEYAAPVWAPYQAKHCMTLERIQHRFLRRASVYTCRPMRFNDHCYDYMQNELKLLSLENRRIIIGQLFLYGLLNGRVDCSALLSRINFHAPMRALRHSAIFQIERHRTLYGRLKPLNRICIIANHLSKSVDVFHMSLNLYRRALHSIVPSLQILYN